MMIDYTKNEVNTDISTCDVYYQYYMESVSDMA